MNSGDSQPSALGHMASNRIEIRVSGDDVEATKMLAVAANMLKLLKAAEKGLPRETPKATPLRWAVGIMSGAKYGIIELWTIGEGPRVAATIDASWKARRKEASIVAAGIIATWSDRCVLEGSAKRGPGCPSA